MIRHSRSFLAPAFALALSATLLTGCSGSVGPAYNTPTVQDEASDQAVTSACAVFSREMEEPSNALLAAVKAQPIDPPAVVAEAQTFVAAAATASSSISNDRISPLITSATDAGNQIVQAFEGEPSIDLSTPQGLGRAATLAGKIAPEAIALGDAVGKLRGLCVQG